MKCMKSAGLEKMNHLGHNKLLDILLAGILVRYIRSLGTVLLKAADVRVY